MKIPIEEEKLEVLKNILAENSQLLQHILKNIQIIEQSIKEVRARQSTKNVDQVRKVGQHIIWGPIPVLINQEDELQGEKNKTQSGDIK